MRRAVITCFFNRLHHLDRSMSSVVDNIAFKDFDYFVFIDYNDDHTVKEGLERLQKKYVKHSNIYWIFRELNLGGKDNWLYAWKELSISYDYVLSIEDDILLSKVALDYCMLMEQELVGNTVGFCLWRDKRWDSVIRLGEYTRSHEFSAWGWYTKSKNLDDLLHCMTELSWIKTVRPSNLIEYVHLFKVLKKHFYWGDRLISVYARRYNKNFIHSGVSLAYNIGLDGSGLHSGIIEIEQEPLFNKVISLRYNELADQELVSLKYATNSKYSKLAHIYFFLWYRFSKFVLK